MQFFESVEIAPTDPILGLSLAFKEDARADKVNLGVGVYKTADLKPLVLASVKKAEEWLLQEETSKEYLPIDGDKTFVEESKKFLFGPLVDERIYGAQSVGGTGALRVGADKSDNYLAEAIAQDSKTQYLLVENERIPVEDRTYDFVFSSHVLLMIPTKEELNKLFADVNRVLKKDGIFIAVTGSEEMHSKERQWLSYDTNFPENENPKMVTA